MSGEAAATNVAVGSETTINSKANSSVSFSDFEAMDNAEKKAAREKKDKAPKQEHAKADRAEPEDQKAVGALDTGKQSVAKPVKKKDADDGKEERGAGEPEPKQDFKPRKPHKFRHGESEYDLDPEAMTTVMVDGAPVEVPLHEVLGNYSGKVSYNKKYSELGAERDRFQKEKGELDGFIQEFFQRSQSDPDTAWDLLAEASGKDPLEFKEQILRSQMAELEPLFAMGEEERERYMQDKKLNWREKRLTNKERMEAESSARQKHEQERKNFANQFGMDDSAWKASHDLAKKWTNGKDPTPTQVVAASRYQMTFDAIAESVPDLVGTKDYGRIVEDAVSIAMESPGMTKEVLSRVIKRAWGDDDANLKKVSRKVLDQARSEGNDLRQKPKKDPNKEVWNFDQLE